MKQSLLDRYLGLLEAWNSKHNIIGRVEARDLYNQAKGSLSTLPSSISEKNKLLVDVGAGCGIMGMAWALMAPENKVFFIEPDRKSSSFLLLVISSFPELKGRILCSDQRFESVSRETVSTLDENFFLVSRAFSPASALEPLYRHSAFCSDPFFVFLNREALPKEQKYVLQLMK